MPQIAAHGTECYRALGTSRGSLGRTRAGSSCRPEIGERLFISPKTVEHHVGRILAKLGLPSRARAVAYAAAGSGPR